MAANLKKTQEEIHNPVIGELEFTVEAAGTKSNKSPKLKKVKKGIHLHFLRIGAFESGRISTIVSPPEKDGTNNEGQTLEDKVVKKIDGVKKLENFYFAVTSFREGYIYLIEKGNPSNHHELEIQDNGELKPVFWDRNKENGTYLDFREAEKTEQDGFVAKEDEVYWVGYSPVQWSVDYHGTFLNDEGECKKLLQKVTFKGIDRNAKSASGNENIIPYHQVKANYKLEGQKKENQSKTKDTAANHLDRILKKIHADELSQDKKGDNEVCEDLFLILEDPIGCAREITSVLSDKIIDFQALVETIQTGETIEKAKERITANTPKIFSGGNKEHQDLFTLALACYHFVYGKDQQRIEEYDGGSIGLNLSDRYGNDSRPLTEMVPAGKDGIELVEEKITSTIYYGLDYQKINGILGIDLRTKRREEIESFRNDLGEVLMVYFEKKTWLNTLKSFHENSKEASELITCLTNEFFSHILKPVHNYDKALMLQHKYEQINDKFKSTDKYYKWAIEIGLKKQPSKVSNLAEIANKPLDVDIVTNQKTRKFTDLANKLKVTAAAYLENTMVIGFSTGFKIVDEKKIYYHNNPVPIEYVQGRLRGGITKSIDTNNKPFLRFTNKKKAIKNAEKAGWVFNEGESIPYKIKGSRRKTRKANNVSAYNKLNDTEIRKVEKSNEANKILRSPHYQLVSSFLGLINVVAHATEIDDETNNIDYLGFTEASVGFTQDLLDLQKTYTLYKGKDASALLNNSIKISGRLSLGLTAAICIKDGIQAAEKKQSKLAVLHYSAAFAYSIGFLVTFKSIAILSGPAGWVTLVIGTGLVALANFLTHTDLQNYFKHFLLCDKKELKVGDKLPNEYSAELLDDKKKFISDHLLDKEEVLKKMTNPKDALAYLHDLTICSGISYNMHTSRFIGKNGLTATFSKNIYLANSFKVTFSILKLLPEPSQISVKGFLPFDKNIDKVFDIEVINVKESEPNSNEIQKILKLPDFDEIPSSDKIIIAIRIVFDKKRNHYFPSPLGNERPRYMAAEFDLKGSSPKSSRLSKVKYESLLNLIKDKIYFET